VIASLQAGLPEIVESRVVASCRNTCCAEVMSASAEPTRVCRFRIPLGPGLRWRLLVSPRPVRAVRGRGIA